MIIPKLIEPPCKDAEKCILDKTFEIETLTMMLPCQQGNQMSSQFEYAHQFYLLIPAISPGTIPYSLCYKEILCKRSKFPDKEDKINEFNLP